MQTIAQQLCVKEFPFLIKNSSGQVIYFESSDGYWCKYEHDINGKEVYFKNSNGYTIDERTKTEVQKAIELLEKEGILVNGKILKN